MVRRVDIERCRAVAEGRGGRCLSEVYANSKTKLRWCCVKGHEWWATWNNIQQGKWCPLCAGIRPVGIGPCRETAEQNSGECLSTEYINAFSVLLWRCAEGHEWWAVYSSVQGGHWCPFCDAERRGRIYRVDITHCECAASKKGGHCLSAEYINARVKLHWQCANGHVWKAAWEAIQQGHWCPICARENTITIERCRRAAAERGGECLSRDYVNVRTKLHWRCAKGHEWNTVWGRVQQGNWCPKCGREKSWTTRRAALSTSGAGNGC